MKFLENHHIAIRKVFHSKFQRIEPKSKFCTIKISVGIESYLNGSFVLQYFYAPPVSTFWYIML